MLVLIISTHASWAKNDSVLISEIDSVLNLAYDYILDIHIDSAITYASAALTLSESIGYSEGITRSTYQIGEMLMASGHYHQALNYFERSSKEKFTKRTPLYLSQIHKQLGQISTYSKLYEEAHKEFRLGLQAAKKIKNKDHSGYISSQIYESLAHLFTITNEPDSVFVYLSRNQLLLESMDESFVYPNLVNVYTSFGHYYAQSGSIKRAEDYLNNAIQLAEKYQFPYVSRAYTYLSDIAFAKDELDLAIVLARKAINNIKRTNLTAELPDIYDRLSTIYESSNQQDSANIYKNKSLQIENTLTNEKFELSNQTVKLLKDNEHKAKTKLIINTAIVILILSIVLVSLIMYFTYRYRLKKGLLAKQESMEKKVQETVQTKMRINESFSEVLNAAKRHYPIKCVSFT